MYLVTILRDVTRRAIEVLDDGKILLFLGARQAGKTTILRQLEAYLRGENRAVYYLTLEDPMNKQLLNQHPDRLFDLLTQVPGQRLYVLIDEVQYLNDPTNFLKYHYDMHQEQLKLLVSGSSAFYIDNKFTDSLAGRKRIYTVSTLSFGEFLRFKGQTGMEAWLERPASQLGQADRRQLGLYYGEYLLYGGYPEVVLADTVEAKWELLADLVYSYVKKDIVEAGLTQDEIYYQLLRILADQVGQLTNQHSLAQRLGVSKTMVSNYLYVMQKSFQVALVRPWYGNVSKELRKMPKGYFLDTGMRNFLVKSRQPVSERVDRGELLENGVFRGLYDRSRGRVDLIRFWRTQDRHEVDFVYDEREAYEVKFEARRYDGRKYKKFVESYPDIGLRLVSMGGGVSSLWPWEVGT